MGLLPEDYNIKVSLLVKLWIVEGLLKHSSKSLEADAEEYLENLAPRNLAAYADSSPYEMRFMDDEKSWDLFKHKISRDFLSEEVEMIAYEIARSCRGLPLAVVVIAGILSCVSESPASWAEVARNVKKATSKDNRMEEIVSLGYNHLPHRLRACLIYMGLLPEDYSIRVSLLIKLWTAEGFLKHPDDSSKSLEADAEEYLEDLARRNLILVTERKYNGKIKRCSLHDMLRETCIRMLEEEKHLRHATAEDEIEGCISKRSLLRFVYNYDNWVNPFFLKRFRLLRVLHAPMFVYNSLEMLKLYHLRHLCFRRQERLPQDISKFQNLQSIIIEYPWITHLPSSIWKLRQLRHLICTECWLPAPDDDATPALENFHTLKKVKCNPSLLQRIPSLTKLGLILDPYASYDDERLNESLVCLRQLEELKMIFRHTSHYRTYGYVNRFSAILPGWLREFTLEHCKAYVSFVEAFGSLPNLEVLKLRSCRFDHATWVVRGGEFPKLKRLQLSELKDIRNFIVEEDGSTAFPMLNCLRINSCCDLEELSDKIGDIPTLELIEVSYSGEAVCDWATRVEERQQYLGNDTLQVRIIHSLI